MYAVPRCLSIMIVLLFGSTLLPTGAASAHPLVTPANWHILVDSTFATPSAPRWPLGNGGLYNRHVDADRYTVSVAKGASYTDLPNGLPALGDGQISATFRRDGHGQVGLAARVNQTAETGYTFWIDELGQCGAARWADGVVELLFVLQCPAISPTGDNLLRLAVRGGQLLFELNGQLVDRYTDTFPLPPGSWGLYLASDQRQSQVLGHFAHITIVGAPLTTPPPLLTPGPFQPMIDYDFALGDNYSWGTGVDDHTSAVIAAGYLTIRAKDQYTRVVTSRQAPTVADGQIATIVRMQGAGRVGVSARWRKEADGYFTEDTCWIDQKADVGLTREVDGVHVTLLELHSTALRPGRANELVLRLQGGHITCFVNGQRVVTYLDRHPLPPGSWGAYVTDYPGGPFVQGQFARILIAD